MRTSTDSDILVEPAEVTPRRGITHGDIPIVVLRHALAANGFGDVGSTVTASSERPMSYELYHAARAHRSFSLGEIVVAAIQAAGALARRVYVRYRQRRDVRATYDALHQLDDRTLRDLGFDRSEISSVAAEVTGAAEYTRVRALQTVGPASEQEPNERITMHRYETSTPRLALGIAAAAMTVLTIGVFVVAPAILDAGAHEPEQLATSTITTPASTGAVARTPVQVAAVHEPGLTRLHAHRRIASRKIE